MDDLFVDLFSKTFFSLSAQLFITWATTQVLFSCLKRSDPKLGDPDVHALKELIDHNPDHFWLKRPFFMGLIWGSFALFLVLLFWGIDQPLPVSFGIFSLWSILTGIQLEYVLLTIDHGVGRKALAFTATIVLATGLIGIYSKINFSFLSIPLFIGLIGLLIFNTFSLFTAMKNTAQRLAAGFGVALFTLYLVFDFNGLSEKESSGENSWPMAMHIAIKIYLDIINLFLQLLIALGHGHH